MGRIDSETVRRILDTADIVEVVSDFVSLKKRGANYIGLCPFHNERTPSFSVSKSKGICKCFSCGKGGSPVNFLMELEQMSFSEALRWLANKYHIEIKEHEQTEEERLADNKRQNMLVVNDFAMRYYESVMTGTEAGRAIGMAYFRERGINEAMIKRFHLGYAPEERDALQREARNKGFNEEYLLETGLCYRTERGTVNDRFRGRVIYPVLAVSGKVVAFGGRTLKTDKSVAKYVNSPESLIYKKSNELYGLYQARQAIVKRNVCILVEGYMDVISMHQAGVENVVASSGTSLTEGQIRLIHRFTENVIVIYDSDAAGIKASLRGIDMLLAEGLNVKVLLLPDGDDPDSFAQSHSSSEVEEYIAANATDFIAFKTRILLDDAGNDPIAKSRVIQSIVRSISMISNLITRTVYIGECSRKLGVDENVLTLQVSKFIAERMEATGREEERRHNRAAAGLPEEDDTNHGSGTSLGAQPEHGQTSVQTAGSQPIPQSADAKFLRRYESDLVRYGVRYGRCYIGDDVGDDGTMTPLTVLDYLRRELNADDIVLSNGDLQKTLDAAIRAHDDGWDAGWSDFTRRLESDTQRMHNEGIEQIRREAIDTATIDKQELALKQKIDDYSADATDKFCEMWVQRVLTSSDDDVVRRTATAMVTSKHHLSKIHTKFAKIEQERDRLSDLLPLAVYNLKEALIECRIRHVMEQIAATYRTDPSNMEAIKNLMERNKELNELKMQLSKYLGERVVSPRR